MFAFSLISQHWDDTGSWNPSSWKTRTHLSCSQYHGCWWPGDAQSQGISRYGTDHVPQYSGFSIIRVNPLCAGTKLFQFNIVKIMVADALAPCVTRTSQPWHWLCRIGTFFSYIRKDFNYLCHVSVEESQALLSPSSRANGVQCCCTSTLLCVPQGW